MEFLSLPPLYCHQRQAKPCIRAVRGGDRLVSNPKKTCLASIGDRYPSPINFDFDLESISQELQQPADRRDSQAYISAFQQQSLLRTHNLILCLF